MDERDYKAMNATETTTRNNKVVLIAILLLFLFMASIGIYIRKTIVEVGKVNNSDSLNLALAIEKKQHGIEQSILLNEIETANRKLQSAIIAKDSLRQREISLTSTNVTLMKKLRQTLPKECDTVFVLCDEIINVKDSSYAALFSAFQLCADVSEIKDSLIVSYQAENVMDSTMLAISKDETKAAKKLARKQRNGKRAAIGFGLGMLVLYVISGVVN
jgi:hypothetical protein